MRALSLAIAAIVVGSSSAWVMSPVGAAHRRRRRDSVRLCAPDTTELVKKKLAELEGLENLVPKRGNDGIGGRDRTKVTVFGARLDSDVAGADVVQQGDEEHEQLFAKGVQALRGGYYKDAVTAFTQAVAAAPGGMSSRKGGEYAVWLAQALHAASRSGDAMRLLKKVEAHPDGDVRKIGDAVLYVMQAPELKLGEENFMKIPEIVEVDTWGTPRRAVEDKDPPPEKYSIEWYLERAAETERKNKASPEPSRQSGGVAALAVLVAACGAAAIAF